MKFKKIILFVVIIILLSFGIVYFLGNDPKIYITATISSISDDELTTVTSSESNISKPTKDDFKKLSFKLNIKNHQSMEDKNISLPNFKQDFEKFSDTIYVYGHDNKEEGFSGEIYDDEVVLFTRGINEDNIKNILKESKAIITWKNKDGSEKKQECIISDILKFE